MRDFLASVEGDDSDPGLATQGDCDPTATVGSTLKSACVASLHEVTERPRTLASRRHTSPSLAQVFLWPPQCLVSACFFALLSFGLFLGCRLRRSFGVFPRGFFLVVAFWRLFSVFCVGSHLPWTFIEIRLGPPTKTESRAVRLLTPLSLKLVHESHAMLEAIQVQHFTPCP